MRSTAWQEGYDAYYDMIDECPYESGSAQYNDWWAGWGAAIDSDGPSFDDVPEAAG